MKFKKDDTIKIISGNDKGKQGKIIVVFPKSGKVVVNGINLRKKHRRPRRAGQKGEIISIPAPLNISRIMLVCSKCGDGRRVGFKISDSGEKVRICKKCDTVID